MLKRRGSTHVRATKVKKRHGVGSRTILVPDSDEEDLPPTASDEYARMTKTRVGAPGKLEGVSMASIPIFERSGTPTPLEEDVDNFVDAVVEDGIPAVPAKQSKRVNDSVSGFNQTDTFILLTTL